MISGASTLQIFLAAPLLVWAIVSFIMTLEDENRGKKASSSFLWIMTCAPRWHKRVTVFVMLPLFVAWLLCRYLGM
jgi:hypothetical protein